MFTKKLNKKLFVAGLSALLISGINPVFAEEAQEETASEEQVVYTNDGAVILLFHRFGEDRYPSTSITTEQLDDFINYINENEFKVLKLADVISAIQSGEKLPEKAIVITIDDAFKSVYEVAYPKFKENSFPFTVFVSSKGVNENNPAYMNWGDIVEMSNNGVDFQAHTVSHAHMTTKSLSDNSQELEKNINDIKQHTDINSTMFAYPYGEANDEIINMVKERGMVAGFSQHSGVYNATSDQFYIPRFSINEKWGTLKRLKLILNTKPFKTTSVEPVEPYIRDENPPMVSVEVDPDVTPLTNLNCFRSDTGKVSLEKTNSSFDMTFVKPFNKGRTRINCTVPNGDGTFKWLGFQFTRD